MEREGGMGQKEKEKDEREEEGKGEGSGREGEGTRTPSHMSGYTELRLWLRLALKPSPVRFQLSCLYKETIVM